MSQHLPQRPVSTYSQPSRVAEGYSQQANGSHYHSEDDVRIVEAFERNLRARPDYNVLMPLVIIITGMGFFIDSYELFAINLTSTIIEIVYSKVSRLFNAVEEYTHAPSINPDTPNSTSVTNPTDPKIFLESLRKASNSKADLQLKVAASSGTVLGSVFFGWLGDRYGRKRIYGVELLIIVVTTLAQAVAGNGIERSSMGIAVGGDYPSSAIIASEYFTSVHRGKILSGVFAFQGLGTLTAGIVTMICLKAYNFTDTPGKLDQIWRIIVGFVCLPGVIAVLFRYAIAEPPRYRFFAERNPEKVQRSLAQYLQHNQGNQEVPDLEEVRMRLNETRNRGWEDFRKVLGKEWKRLACLSYAWFVVDFSFYGLNLNTSAILRHVPRFKDVADAGSYLKRISEGNFILLFGLLVGHALSICFIDKIGRKSMQLMGFICVTVLLLIMGFLAKDPKDPAWTGFFAIYVVLNVFQNFGANTTTFVLPAEYFPTRYRSTFYGIAAAVGKLGAVVTQILYWKIQGDGEGDKDDSQRIMILLFIYAGVSLTGIIPTLLLDETKKRPLERISHDDEQRADLRFVRAHGIHTGDYQQHALNKQHPEEYPLEGLRQRT